MNANLRLMDESPNSDRPSVAVQHEDSTVALRTACAKAFTLTDALNRAEVPSVHERAQAQSVAEVKRRASRPVLKPFAGLDILEPELEPVDRVLQRWWSSVGSGLPNPDVDPPADSPPPPLDNDCAIVMDQIVCQCPGKTRRFIRLWYTTAIPCQRIGQLMGLTDDRSLHLGWRVTLLFVHWRILESDHPELNRLASLRDI